MRLSALQKVIKMEENNQNTERLVYTGWTFKEVWGYSRTTVVTILNRLGVVRTKNFLGNCKSLLPQPCRFLAFVILVPQQQRGC